MLYVVLQFGPDIFKKQWLTVLCNRLLHELIVSFVSINHVFPCELGIFHVDLL